MQAGEYLLARQSILKLGEPTANVLFFVIRDRKKGMPATTAEHKAVRTACKVRDGLELRVWGQLGRG